LKKTAKCVEYKHTQSAQCSLVKTDTTEQFTASLEVEQQGYRHFPDACSLTRNTWYNTTSRVAHWVRP